ncbi:hypothetical protein [Streptomyces sp. NPDC126933]|uniref:zinc ribbon domain-containing protein n=1 Tax=unclassified Streptomyces TaxID=2593676 RepID=UPI00364B55A7
MSGLARTWLAKSVYDAGWSTFVAMLEYKAAKHGRYFGKIGRFEPTSQICSVDGEANCLWSADKTGRHLGTAR